MTWNIDMNNIAKLDTFKYLMFEPNVESIAYADFIFNPKKLRRFLYHPVSFFCTHTVYVTFFNALLLDLFHA